jgi:ethanolamine ammonia-lyase large subunit
MPVIKKANTTIGLPGTFSCRLQPNDTRDDAEYCAQIYEGLSFGAGDAVIGVNPVTDDVENLSRVLDTVYGVIDKFNIPTQGCVLARDHPDRSDSSRCAGRADFPEYLRQRKRLKRVWR